MNESMRPATSRVFVLSLRVSEIIFDAERGEIVSRVRFETDGVAASPDRQASSDGKPRSAR